MSFRIPSEGMKNPLAYWLMHIDGERHERHRLKAIALLEAGAKPLAILAEHHRAEEAFRRWERAHALFKGSITA